MRAFQQCRSFPLPIFWYHKNLRPQEARGMEIMGHDKNAFLPDNQVHAGFQQENRMQDSPS
jgi:hypothetical protein